MLERQLQKEQQLTQEDAAFEKKWQVSLRGNIDSATQFNIWKKFLKRAPVVLDYEGYEELPAKLEEEDFQLPTLTSAVHDDEKYSQDADSRQEFEAHILEEERHPHQRTLSLDELKQQLNIWSTRNLTIFFVEYLIDSEIAASKALDAGHSSNIEVLEKRITKIEKMYGHILKTLNHADYYLTQPAIFDPIYTTHPKKYDIENECAHLKKILDNLSMLSSTKQLELLKLKIRIETYGIVLPHSDEMLTLAGLNDKQCQQEMDAIFAAEKLAAEQTAAEKAAEYPESNNGGLRKSKRVTSDLHALDDICYSDDDEDDKDDEAARLLPAAAAPVASPTVSPQPTRSSFAKDILFGIAIGIGLAILVAGITAAVIFANAVTLGGATLGFIFGGILAAGIVGGFFGGALKSCCQPHTAQPMATPPVTKTINAGLHAALGASRSTAVSHASPVQDNKNGKSTDEAIALAPSASPASQSQETLTASARNASLR